MNNPTYIIAEIGINHEGSIDLCKKMIESAAICGVDAVKLQTIDADANYVKGTGSYNIFKGAELTQEETCQAFEFAQNLGLDIFTTAGDVKTIDWVNKLNPSHWKISSGLLTHIPIIEYLANLGRPLLISTGMANELEIDLAIKTVRSSGNQNICLLQCTSIYPTPIEEVNLSVIGWLKKKYQIPVGFSDHSNGDDAVFLSIAAGASIIEKHFSLDINRDSFDHKVSLDENGLKKMVERVRLAEMLLGRKEKVVSKKIEENRVKFLRYIVATQKIYKNNTFTKYNIGIKRTPFKSVGISPKEINNIYGKVSDREYNIDDIIVFEESV